jgi:hypothetical protein
MLTLSQSITSMDYNIDENQQNRSWPFFVGSLNTGMIFFENLGNYEKHKNQKTDRFIICHPNFEF